MRARAFPSAWTTCSFGAQAFRQASAFNANIGAWNTASVSEMAWVCAAFPARRRASAGVLGAHGRASMQRGPLCAGATADARARAREAAASAGVDGCWDSCAEERCDTFIYAYRYIYI